MSVWTKAMLPLLALTGVAMAQNGARPEKPHCTARTASRFPEQGCDAASPPVVVREGVDIKTKLPAVKLAPVKSNACHVNLSLDYGQYDTAVHVHSVIKNATCAASRGSYVMNVAIRDSNGRSKKLAFDETWKRENDQPVVSKKQYPIGKNVDLVRVWATRLECHCSAPTHN